MRIIIYGAGQKGKYTLERVKENHVIVGVADRDSQKIGKKLGAYTIIAPEDIGKEKYDYIVVSVVGKFDEIKNDLTSLGIDRDKIIEWSDFITLTPHNTGTMGIEWNDQITPNNLYDKLCNASDNYSEMERFFLTGKHNRSFKWLHYFEVYNRHFARYFGKDITIMEIGVNKGGSLQIWKHMFGKGSKIIGVDINPECKTMEDDQISIFIGDQENRLFWESVRNKVPKLDILIDDGGHYMNQQIVTFEEMFQHVKDDGIYLCEDIGTSYDVKKYNSGYHNPNTFVEYSKNFIDFIHAWYSQEQELQENEYTHRMHSLHYYYGALVIEKGIMYPPFDMEVCNTDEEKYAIPHFKGRL